MTKKKKLLVIDDDVAICEILRILGERCGFDVTTTQTPDTFLEKFTQLKPDNITLDLNLGEHDGIEVLRKLAENKCEAKIIVVSGFDEKVIESALLLGRTKNLNIIGSLHKPIDTNQLRYLLSPTHEKELSITHQSIEQAITKNEFTLFYQPKIEIQTGKFIGVEALVRWRPPENGLVPPDSFIRIAEEDDLIAGLSAWVNQEAIKDCKALKEKGFECCVSVNISAKLLTNLMLPDEIYKMIKAHGMEPKHLCVEITETTAMGNVSLTMDVLTRFRIKGFSVSIDDFGTGYSSLVELQRMPFSELKIDKSFIMQLKKGSSHFIITRSIINLAKSFGLKVVAEGVETKLGYDILKELGCDIAQGYYIGHPMARDDLMSWLETNLNESKVYIAKDAGADSA